MAMSLDGLIAGPNDEDHGLHDYLFAPAGATLEVIEEGFRTAGTIIMGRRSYDIGAAQDGFADSSYQVPTFALTHHLPGKIVKGAGGSSLSRMVLKAPLNRQKLSQVTEMSWWEAVQISPSNT
jgi:dihydrofolate reductase